MATFDARLQNLFQNRKVKMVAMIAGIALVSYLAIGSWLSKVHISEQKAHNAWVILKDSCDRRLQMMPQFIQIIQAFAPQAQDLLQILNHTYAAASQLQASEKILSDPTALEAFTASQKSIADSLMVMERKVANYPVLGQNRQYFMLKMQLQGVEQQIIFANEVLNRETRRFNYFISGFPKGWANTLILHEKQRQPLTVSTIEKNSS